MPRTGRPVSGCSHRYRPLQAQVKGHQGRSLLAWWPSKPVVESLRPARAKVLIEQLKEAVTFDQVETAIGIS